MTTKPKCPVCGCATTKLFTRKGKDGNDGLKSSGDFKCPKCGKVV